MATRYHTINTVADSVNCHKYSTDGEKQVAGNTKADKPWDDLTR